MNHRVYQHVNGNIIVIDTECGLMMQHSAETNQSTVGHIGQEENDVFIGAFANAPEMKEIVFSSEAEQELVCLDTVKAALNAIVAAVKAKA